VLRPRRVTVTLWRSTPRPSSIRPRPVHRGPGGRAGRDARCCPGRRDPRPGSLGGAVAPPTPREVTRLDGGAASALSVDTQRPFPQIRGDRRAGPALLDCSAVRRCPGVQAGRPAYAARGRGVHRRLVGIGGGTNQRAGVRLALRPGQDERSRGLARGLNITSGLVLSDRNCPRTCCTHRMPRWRTAPT